LIKKGIDTIFWLVPCGTAKLIFLSTPYAPRILFGYGLKVLGFIGVLGCLTLADNGNKAR